MAVTAALQLSWQTCEGWQRVSLGHAEVLGFGSPNFCCVQSLLFPVINLHIAESIQPTFLLEADSANPVSVFFATKSLPS